MKPRMWSQAEFNHLDTLAGNVPTVLLIRYYNSWAKRNGYPRRTKQAIECKLIRHGISSEAIGDWLTTGHIAAVLGSSYDTPQRWITRGWLPAFKASRHNAFHYIRRADVIDLARRRPELFGGVVVEQLAGLLEDHELAERIAREFPHRIWRRRPVRCRETGKVYPSMKAAADANFLVRQSITYALQSGGTAAGFHWELVS